VPESSATATDLDLISYLKSIPDARMRRGVRIPPWYLLLVAVLGILSGCQSLRDLERFAIRHHSAMTEALGPELRRPPSDSSFRYFFLQVDVAALCAAIRDWPIAQIPGGAADLYQLVCDGKTLRGSIVPIASGGRRKASSKGIKANPHRLLAVSQPGVGDAAQLQIFHQLHQLLIGLGRHAIESRLVAVEHRHRHAVPSRHGGHGVLLVFRDAHGGLGQHAVRHQQLRPDRSLTIGRVKCRWQGLGIGLGLLSSWILRAPNGLAKPNSPNSYQIKIGSAKPSVRRQRKLSQRFPSLSITAI